MSRVRTYSIKFLFLIVALQILNLSVYGNAYVETVVLKNNKKKTQINQIDSLAEYIVEIVLKHTNAFPEQKGNHTKNENKSFKAPFKIITRINVVEEKETKIASVTKPHSHYSNNYDYLFFKEINPPPPKI